MPWGCLEHLFAVQICPQQPVQGASWRLQRWERGQCPNVTALLPFPNGTKGLLCPQPGRSSRVLPLGAPRSLSLAQGRTLLSQGAQPPRAGALLRLEALKHEGKMPANPIPSPLSITSSPPLLSTDTIQPRAARGTPKQDHQAPNFSVCPRARLALPPLPALWIICRHRNHASSLVLQQLLNPPRPLHQHFVISAGVISAKSNRSLAKLCQPSSSMAAPAGTAHPARPSQAGTDPQGKAHAATSTLVAPGVKPHR